MQKDHYRGEITQKVLITDGEKVLIIRGVDEKGWDFPGGRIHFNEKPLEGVKREILEELSIDIKDEQISLKKIDFVQYPDTDLRFMAVYRCVLPEIPEVNHQVEEIKEYRWISKEEIDNFDLYPEFRSILEEFFS